MSLESVKAEIADWTAEQRSDLLAYLVEGNGDVEHDGVREAWRDELERRVGEIRSGAVQGIPGEAVFGRIDEKLGR